MKTELRVIWKREGNRPKSKRVMRMPTAQRWVGILTSPEPWKFLKDTEGKAPDDYYCCDGGTYSECGCGGLTIREWCDGKRKDLAMIAVTGPRA